MQLYNQSYDRSDAAGVETALYDGFDLFGVYPDKLDEQVYIPHVELKPVEIKLVVCDQTVAQVVIRRVKKQKEKTSVKVTMYYWELRSSKDNQLVLDHGYYLGEDFREFND